MCTASNEFQNVVQSVGSPPNFFNTNLGSLTFGPQHPWGLEGGLREMEDDPVPLDVGLDSLVNGLTPAPFACEELSQGMGVDRRLIRFMIQKM